MKSLFEALSFNVDEQQNVTGPVRHTVTMGGKEYSVKFDVNKNPTKVGIKVQFFPKGDVLQGSELNDVANEMAVKLSENFAKYGMIIERDKDFRDKFDAVGFIVPLDSLSVFLLEKVMGGKSDIPSYEEEEPEQSEPEQDNK